MELLQTTLLSSPGDSQNAQDFRKPEQSARNPDPRGK
jgi:hypothetical protein